MKKVFEDSSNEEVEMVAYVTTDNLLLIEIEDRSNTDYSQPIFLTKEEAVLFRNELTRILRYDF